MGAPGTGLKLRHELGVMPDAQLGVRSFDGSQQPQLIQPPGLRGHRLERRYVGERRPAPQLERIGQPLTRRLRIAGREQLAAFQEQTLEDDCIDPVGGDLQDVAVAVRDKSGAVTVSVLEHPTHTRHQLMDGVHRSVGRCTIKEAVDESIGADGLVAVQEQERKQRALAVAIDPKTFPASPNLDRAENTELQSAP